MKAADLSGFLQTHEKRREGYNLPNISNVCIETASIHATAAC